MRQTAPHAAPRDDRPRTRRPSHALDPCGVLSERQTAAAMDDAAEAEQLMDDLLALIDAGLIHAIEDGGPTRYAPADGTAEDLDR